LLTCSQAGVFLDIPLLWPGILPRSKKTGWFTCSQSGVFLDSPVPQPVIHPRSWWLSLTRNLTLNFLDSLFGEKILRCREKKSFLGSDSMFSLSAMGFFQNQEERVKQFQELD
jgi:hypothetical protein